jgi:hypothetical protein
LSGLALDFAHLEELREFVLAAQAKRLSLPSGFAAEIRKAAGVARLRLLPHEAKVDVFPL